MKKITIKVLVLSMMMSLVSVMSALADAWIPPDDNYNDALMSCPYNDEECKGLNTFLSNYAEANVYYFGSDSSDSVAIAGALKHIELNGKAEKTFRSDSGSEYMSVAGSVFEETCNRYFRRNIKASSCPGFSDGRIIVSAQNYKAPLKVFASTVYCTYEGNYKYLVSFEVFKCDGNAQDYYGIARNNLPSNVKKIGEGECNIEFSGKQTSFKSSDFRLIRIKMSNNDPQYTNENIQYVGQDNTVSDNDSKESAERDRMAEEYVSKETDTPDNAPKEDNADTKSVVNESGSSLPIPLLIIAIGAVVLSALIATIILLLFKKK